MKKIIILIGGVGLFVATACSPNALLQSSEARATQDAQATARVETAVFVGTQVGTLSAMQSTADAAVILGTQLAQLEQENSNLQGTINAVTTQGLPLVARFTATPPPQPTSPAELSEYADVRTTTDVDENGCPVDKRGRFSQTINRVYVTAEAFDVVAGTPHEVRWYYEGDLRYESAQWIADRDYNQVCVFFWLDTSMTSFDAGLWRADLYIDNEIYVEVPFELCTAGELC